MVRISNPFFSITVFNSHINLLLRYDAIRAWNKCLTSPDSEYWVQLTPGTAVGALFLHPSVIISFPFLTVHVNPSVVDNHRVLHGRSSFDGKRRMCGAYIGVDEYNSKLAVLTEKFAPEHVGASSSTHGRSIWNLAI